MFVLKLVFLLICQYQVVDHRRPISMIACRRKTICQELRKILRTIFGTDFESFGDVLSVGRRSAKTAGEFIIQITVMLSPAGETF